MSLFIDPYYKNSINVYAFIYIHSILNIRSVINFKILEIWDEAVDGKGTRR